MSVNNDRRIIMGDSQMAQVIEPETRHMTTCTKIVAIPAVLALTGAVSYGIICGFDALSSYAANHAGTVMLKIPGYMFTASVAIAGLFATYAIASDCNGGGTRECAPGRSFDPCGF